MMIILYIIITIAILGLAYMRFETTRLKVNKVYYSNRRDSLKVIHLSDLHLIFLKVNINKVKKVLKAENPDLVIITGDYINNVSHIPLFLKFLDDIKGDYKILACLGNHDYKTLNNNESEILKFVRQIEEKGVTVLLNDSICFEKNNRKYNLIGIEDLRSNRYDVKKALESCCDDAVANIAFSHNPDMIFQIPEGSVDYLLCGHFHGGQIWMPFHLEFIILRNEKLCKMGITRGAHKVNNINIYINSGLGNVCFPLRFLSPPELTVLHF
jgi:predicted MPP superfamily phosphohydrolase